MTPRSFAPRLAKATRRLLRVCSICARRARRSAATPKPRGWACPPRYCTTGRCAANWHVWPTTGHSASAFWIARQAPVPAGCLSTNAMPFFILLAPTLPGTFGVPRLLEVNAPLIQEQERFRGLVLKSWRRRRNRLPSTARMRSLPSPTRSPPISPQRASHRERIHAVPNGVDTARFLPRGGGADSCAARSWVIDPRSSGSSAASSRGMASAS